MPDEIGERKRELRAEMRWRRSHVVDRDERTVRLWSHLRDVPAVRSARVVMAFEPMGDEPDTGAFLDWCRSVGKTVIVPAHDPMAPPPVAPSIPDVVIVPGLAFTPAGVRLGLGAGWYDRFLPDVRADCTTIGVCYTAQLVDEIPVEPHDIRLDLVVTDQGTYEPG